MGSDEVSSDEDKKNPAAKLTESLTAEEQQRILDSLTPTASGEDRAKAIKQRIEMMIDSQKK